MRILVSNLFVRLHDQAGKDPDATIHIEGFSLLLLGEPD